MQEQLKNCYISDFVVTREEDPTVKVVSYLPEIKNTKIATITVGNSATDIFAPKSNGAGSVVTIDDTLATGTKIATLTIDGRTTDINAPNPGSNVEIDQKLKAGKEIAAIKVDDKESVSIYAPYFEDENIDLKTISDCANAIKKLLVLLGIDESKIHTV